MQREECTIEQQRPRRVNRPGTLLFLFAGQEWPRGAGAAPGSMKLRGATIRIGTLKKYSGSLAGGEGRGLRRGVAEACQHRVFIPLAPGVESLNVSVAVAVALFEVVRQRRRSGGATSNA